LLLIVVIGGFVQEGIGMTSNLPSHDSPGIYSFVGAAFSAVLPSVSMETYSQLWFVHAIASLALIAYIPFSKLFHSFAAPLANHIDEIIRGREKSSAIKEEA
jgi:nitrate reductase gamma subunit